MCFVFVGLWTKPTSFVSKAWLSLSPSRKIDLACRQQAPEQGNPAGSRSELYQLLQQREHVLKRPDMYIGPVEPRNETAWIVKGRKIMEKSLLLSPGLVQIYNEILVNAIDRQFHSSLSEIRIDVDAKTSEISVWNDGGAIPVEIHQSGLYVPSMVFGEFMSGENFNDTGIRFTGGRNGIGAKATNVFSTSFEVTVDDPGTQQRFYQRWEDNMAIQFPHELSPLPPEVQRGSVKVTFKPDLPLFGLIKIDAAHLSMMHSRAFDAAACTSSNVQVTFNNETLTVQGFQEFSKMTLGNHVAVEEVRDQQGRVRAEVAVAFAEQSGFAALGFVNGIRCSYGTHVKLVTDQITDRIAEMVAQQGTSRPSDATVRQYLRIIVKVLVDNPDFDSQTKTRLTTTTHKLGFDFILSSEFIETVAELGVLDAAIKAMEATRLRSMQKALSSGPPPSIAKLEDAMNAGKRGESCTLILTEGDSAKALAVAGLAKVGRENFGVFPLKGKLLNVRGANDKQIQSNTEIKHLMHILGLRWGQEFENAEEVADLRYQRVMIFADQDLDGHHIAGLVINLLATLWPSLLKVQPNFLQRFATPLVKVFPKSSTSDTTWPDQEFFSQGDFDAWQRDEGADWTKHYRAKYYKGLGTSTRAEALQYFQAMDKHVIQVEFEGAKDMEALEKAFEPNRTDDRKEWIKDYDPTEELDYSQDATNFEDFFDKSFLHFSAYDNVRSIPKLMDGLKPSQRKVLYWAIRQLKTEKKVSQITGLVSSATSYHHGEQSLVKVIVNLAQDFVGTNNLNLFEPIGMFGTRLHGRDVHASARYINTKLSPLVPYIFLKEDLDLLPPQLEEGNEIEPRMLLPIFPLVLVNGFIGIGTGWATQGPNFDALQVVDRLMSLIQGEQSDAKLIPSYRGFQGSVTDINGRWVSKGNWQILEGEGIDEDLLIVEITELPVKAWTDDYIQELEKKAEKSRISMNVFKCRDHDDQNVHLLLNLDPEQFAVHNREQALRRFLRLEKSVVSLMWLFTEAEDQSQSLQFFQDAEMVLEAFYRARRPFYAQRKERMIQQISHQVQRLENQLRCIQMYQKGVLEPTVCSLEDQGFARMERSRSSLPREGESSQMEDDRGFKYLLDMPIQRFSVSGAQKFEEKLQQAQRELERLQGLDIDELWLQDLQSFREQYLKVKGETTMHTPALSDEDLDAALNRFSKERRRWLTRVDVSDEVFNVAILSKLTRPELKDRAEQLGLDIRGKLNKQDIIDTLLTYSVIGFKERNWQKLTVPDLKAHLQIRGLSEVGNRQSLINRLCGSRTPPIRFRKLAPEMKEEFRYMGLSTAGVVSELEERYSKVRLCTLEEEQALRNLPIQELRELHPRAGNAEIFERLSRCFALPRFDDLPQAYAWVKMYKPNERERCWVDCIRETRRRLKVQGSCGEQPSFFKEVAKCFRGEDCEEAN